MSLERSYTRSFGTQVLSGNFFTYVMDSRNAEFGVSFQINSIINTGAVAVPSGSITVGGDVWNFAGHGFFTGQVVQLTTSGTLPAGLSLATNYYIIMIDLNNFSIASSYANALAGTSVIISTVGTGTQTATPVAISGYSVKIQWSNDYRTWIDINGATQSSGNWFDAVTGESSSVVTQTISSTGVVGVSAKNSLYAFTRLAVSLAGGTPQIVVIGHNK